MGLCLRERERGRKVSERERHITEPGLALNKPYQTKAGSCVYSVNQSDHMSVTTSINDSRLFEFIYSPKSDVFFQLISP